MKQRTQKETMELEIMHYLNRRCTYASHIFDCGDLGIVELYWQHHGWEKRWLNIKPLPTELEQYCQPQPAISVTIREVNE